MKFKIFLVILIVGFLFFAKTLQAESPTAELQEPTAKEMVAFYFGDDSKIMLAIAKCESSLEHFNKDGSVKLGIVDSRDTGLFQINKGYHLDKSKQMGYNIDTLLGNILYAKYLYEQSGTQPWSASKHCWSKR